MKKNDFPVFISVREVDEDAEEELDKPGTTIGTKFSVLQIIRQYCWRVLEDLHCQEYIQLFDIHNCLFMRLHFSIGGYDYRRTTRFRQSIHFQHYSSPFC